jgi:SAM-dependent methyltransferase
MTEIAKRFDDGAAYERGMGVWSRSAGEIFLDWLALPSGLRCLDVGCGNGAFSELLIERCAPAEVHGVDPSPDQIAFARARPTARVAEFEQGDAMALPFPDNRFDAAIMALVISFVPDPAKGVAEMARVVCPGGTVAAYFWDMLSGASPLEPIDVELRALNRGASRAPNPDASRIETMRNLWTATGLEGVETRQIEVHRTFADFDEFWTVTVAGTLLKQVIATMTPTDVERVKDRVRSMLGSDAAGRVTYGASANAVKGRAPM